MSFTVVIPARYGSSRFPGKPLALIGKKPMIQHVVERAKEAGADNIIVATDDERIQNVVVGFAQVCMTSVNHQSGTERIAEVIEKEGIANDTIVVNVQGDEPFIPAENIRQVANNLANAPQCQMATLSTPIDNVEDVFNPNIVKVLVNNKGESIYFSRSPIPFERDYMMANPKAANTHLYKRHIGIYAYRAEYVKQYVAYTPSSLEQIESLEQLRAIWYGDKIHCEVAIAPPPVGIDTPEDLERLLKTI
ncbi:3-deoxy-manno-octulosonate cytidylyltransferase [Alteromonas macleodii str. 'Black Sea 11']|uniref:3-deoxy-manno-octulosonate cytidylyltransferase n=1 Tax=Alteromonas abrolhosensis TaxID=1892904 RepID=UPI000286EFFD|nr:3-deoxy-manno-octulosonate cytidylyltransferase [Alteromonas abrolhosensis]AFT78346.1 3-deoxy-manno-octulosonate cytidylyltransferase [Alteromonas macleodii str. 'Black Sea 11']NKX04750.1 3-deoxy-manno-octulosonate cytidylyltransferase [Alteromonadaceae bacterium A_SAG6]NKX18198.1 3-deoxy-manno-octulosonate cytidylyltransferase [Alteromonadaceae bacterium A_SAG5]NKX35224.1 3-deoxy-manno-octulosonate cytidylyltransferase [Alteromonadaceae bacterium A_SAG3]